MLVLPGVAVGQATDRWQFAITPYVWLPAIDGSLVYGPPPNAGSTPIVELDAETILGAIDGAFMLAMEAHRDRWFALADYLYVDLKTNNSDVLSIDFGPGTGEVDLGGSTVNAGTSTGVSGSAWSLFVGREIERADRWDIAPVGGFRELSFDFTTDWQLSAAVESPEGGIEFDESGTIGQGERLTHFVIGVRGRPQLADSWFLPFHVDAGAGDSSLSWQAVAGVAREFGFGDVLLVYRYLALDVDDAALLEDLRLAGISAGVSFRF